MFTRDEYKDLAEALTKDVKSKLSAEVKSLLLVGSVAANEHISGESDCDFLFILDKKVIKGQKFLKTLTKIGEIAAKYLEDPLYSSLIDIEIIGEDDLPSDNKKSLYSWTRASMAKNGKALIGDNPFERLKINNDKLKADALCMAREFYEQMKDLVLYPPTDKYRGLYMVVDAVLGCACAYLYSNGETNFYRSNAVMIFEEKYKDKLNFEPLQISQRLRLAAKTVDTKDFIPKSLEFCRNVITELINN